MLTETMILVHGTATGIPDEINPRWWQAKSEFAQMLAAATSSRCALGEPFLWGNGGANSESERRRGGDQLFVCLRDREQMGIKCHLVGHSHGGSVIWHALVQSSLKGHRLQCVRSWTTVGTPFLEFGPDPKALWPIVGLLSTAVSLALLWPAFSTGITERSVAISEGNGWALLLVAGLGSALIAALFFFVFRVVMMAVEVRAARRLKAAERQAAAWYGDMWLGLWHARDEPINGLQASLSEAPRLVPRLANEGRNRLLRLLLKPYDLLAAPFGDAFAWATLMGKVQGSDEIGKIMLSAGPCPAALEPGWSPLLDPLSAKIMDAANERAGASAGRLRDALAVAAKQISGQETFVEIAKVVGWDEIIHTSYFAAPELGSMIAARVGGEQTPERFAAVYPPQSTAGVRQYRAHSWSLPVAFAAFAAVVSIVLGLAFNAGYVAVIEPLVGQYQLKRIAESLRQKRIVTGAEGPLVGGLFARLLGADALPAVRTAKEFRHIISEKVYAAVEIFPSEEQRSAALQRIFFHLGHGKKDNLVAQLLQDSEIALGPKSAQHKAILAVSAKLGYLKRSAAPPGWLVEATRGITLRSATPNFDDVERLMSQKQFAEAKDSLVRFVLGLSAGAAFEKGPQQFESTYRVALKFAERMIEDGQPALGREVRTRVYEHAQALHNLGQTTPLGRATFVDHALGLRLVTELELVAGETTKQKVLRTAVKLIEEAGADTDPQRSADRAARAIILLTLSESPEEFRKGFDKAIAVVERVGPSGRRADMVELFGKLVSFMNLSQIERLYSVAISVADEQSSVDRRDAVLTKLPGALASQKSLRAARIAADRLITANQLLLAYKEILDSKVDAKRDEYGFRLGETDLPVVLRAPEVFPERK